MGQVMLAELKKAGIKFVSYIVVDGIDNVLAESIGLVRNDGHIEYILDSRS